MNLDDIQKLVKMLDDSGLDEMTIEEGDFKITLKRKSNSAQNISLPPSMFMPAAQMLPPSLPTSLPATSPTNAPAPTASTPLAPPEPEPAPPPKKYKEIRSPMVGTFYRAPSPEANPYVQVGDYITKGKVLCIIEAMKLMNEIESDVEGKIVKIMVENAQPVEYDQVLFLVEESSAAG
ncbi:MAG: acetyl-CoA carboxylase biotin carboxyl carrier protein [Candidatus Thermochlorobacter aerophilum]|jgi:acetyl-CoA carboxylase biotin carboxyl carrier protein|uniref:Biotin carboxyl carrier protein of acetyl-CoA carboxylase n=1 Tax=Candidatus Thermochlorobacter aerophilus TaxID=1868324 RepID=A0A395M1M8_9BACT|nr:MAG: acetyl-CoA carboxylase biotin carboxyl carrier protein [Candidatus Thermochlorobacter aerophilum]